MKHLKPGQLCRVTRTLVCLPYRAELAKTPTFRWPVSRDWLYLDHGDLVTVVAVIPGRHLVCIHTKLGLIIVPTGGCGGGLGMKVIGA